MSDKIDKTEEKKHLFKAAEQYEPLSEKTNTQLQDEIAALDLEAKKIEIEYRKQEMAWRAKDMVVKEDAIAKIEAKRNAALETARAKRIATLQFIANREANQKRCNHRKGGRGPEAIMRGMGSDPEYAIIKHRLPHGEYMGLCQRCGKEWMPANKWNTENGVLRPTPATEGWEWAMNANTDNSSSASSDFRFEKVDA